MLVVDAAFSFWLHVWANWVLVIVSWELVSMHNHFGSLWIDSLIPIVRIIHSWFWLHTLLLIVLLFEVRHLKCDSLRLSIRWLPRWSVIIWRELSHQGWIKESVRDLSHVNRHSSQVVWATPNSWLLHIHIIYLRARHHPGLLAGLAVQRLVSDELGLNRVLRWQLLLLLILGLERWLALFLDINLWLFRDWHLLKVGGSAFVLDYFIFNLGFHILKVGRYSFFLFELLLF